MENQIQQFLKAVGHGAEGNYIEVRLIGRGSEWYSSPEALEAGFERLKGLGVDLYFGVCPRFVKSGKKEAVNKVHCLWADLDGHDYQGGKAEAMQVLRDFTIAPTAIIDSGNGYHAYWALSQPYLVSTSTGRSSAEETLRRLARALHADLACAEVARILRIPNTTNHKDRANPKAVTVVSLEPERRYDMAEFDKLSVPAPAVDSLEPAVEPVTIDSLTSQLRAMSAEAHDRYPTMLRVAGSLLGRGLTAEDAYHFILPHAQRVGSVAALDQIIRGLAAKERTKEVTSVTTVTSGDFSGSEVTSASVTSHPLKGGVEVKPSPEVKLIVCNEYMSRPLPEQKWCVEQVVPSEGGGMFAGYGSIGKSWMLMDMALEVSRGGVWLGRFQTTQRPVIYIDRENPFRLHKDRFERLAKDKGMDLSQNTAIHFAELGRLRLDTEAGQAWLEAHLSKLGPCLVLVDSFSKVFSGDENSMKDVVRLTTPLIEIANKTGSFIMLTDHLGKSPSGHAATSLKGSVEKFNFGDTIILAEGAGFHCIDLDVTKQRCTGNDKLIIPILIEDVDDSAARLVIRDESNDFSLDPDAEAVDLVENAFQDRLEVSRQDLVRAGKTKGISERKVDKAIGIVMKRDLIQEVERLNKLTGKPNHHYVWKRPLRQPDLAEDTPAMT